MKYLSLSIPGYGPISPPKGVPTGGFFESNTGNSIISWGISLAFIIAVVLVLFLIVLGAIQWLTSGGDKEKLANARKRIIYAIIGLVTVFFSVLIINLILYFLGAPSITMF